MSGNHHNFGAHGESESELENDIDTSNLVDGKLIYYLIGASNIVIDPFSNEGTVHCINCNNVTLKDLILTNNGYGIYFYNTSNSRIINISSNCYNNIWLEFSNDNTIAGNNASNSYYGIFLGHSSNNILRNNLMSGNQYNFEAWGWGDLEFENNIDTSNFVDGKPIYYLVGVSGTVIDSSSNAGTVYCICCNNVKVKDLTFSNNGKGVCFHNTRDSRIQNIHASNNIVGICLDSSNNNIITGNNVSNNHRYGILLFIHSSSSNKIYLNNFMHNTHNVDFYSSCINIWNSTEPITYQYSGSSFTNYRGNYWSDYKEKYPDAEEIDGCGIWNTPYSIDGDDDNYPLMVPFDNYQTSDI